MKVSELYKELCHCSYVRWGAIKEPVPEHVCNFCGHTEDSWDLMLEHIFLNHKDETIPDVNPVEAI